MINKPIFIVGVPHSGTSHLGRVVGSHPSIISASETNYIWMWGNARKPDDVLQASDLTPRIRKHIESRLIYHINVLPEQRICDKTPRNCLRIPFLYTLFPDAKIILVLRDGRAVVRSIKRQNVEPSNKVMRKEILYRLKKVPITDLHLYLPRIKWIFNRLIGKPIDYWGVRPPGWQSWIKQNSQPVVIAKQWAEATSIARAEGAKLPSSSFLEVRYEDLIFNSGEMIPKVLSFLELENVEAVTKFATNTADPKRVHRWKETLSQETLQEIRPHIEHLVKQLGYEW